jgi:hypothetical protein
MGEHHIGAHELAASGDIVLDERAVVRAELQIELRRPPARVAGAAGGEGDGSTASCEREIRGLERLEQRSAAERCRLRRDAENRVALELRQPERRAEPGCDHAEQVGEDVMGVLELYTRQVRGVAADVGEHENTLSHDLSHGWFAPRLHRRC